MSMTEPYVDKSQTCSQCAFWRQQLHRGVTTFGYCYRYPPQVAADVNGIDFYRPWMHESDWCGEHKPFVPSVPDSVESP